MHHYLARLDPDGTEPDPTEGRSLAIARHADGSRTIRGELDAVGGEKVQAVLESIVQANRPAGDTRTRAQQLGDAFVQAADNTLAAGQLPILRTVKPHVVVMIDVDDLVDPAHRPRRGADRLRRADLRRPGPLAGLRRQRHPDRHRPRGAAAGHGPHPPGRPTPPAPGRGDPRPALRVRRLRRAQPLVRRPPRPEWIDGGDTSLENSALLCESHHTKVHHGFRVERQPDGRWRTYRPDGTEIVLHPHLLAA